MSAGVGAPEADTPLAAPASLRERLAERPRPSAAQDPCSDEKDNATDEAMGSDSNDVGSSDGDGGHGAVVARVCAAAGAVHAAADRVGHIPVGEARPAWLQKLRCPKVMGPLLWEAASSGTERAVPVLQWF